MEECPLSGLHHLAINVQDLEVSESWYRDVLGFSLLFPYDTSEFERRLMRHPSGVVIGLTRHLHPDAGAEFNERRTGLDHIAFAVADLDELERWGRRLSDAGVQHSGVKVTPVTGSALIAFRDPSNIQLEMYLAQGAVAD
ncbi:MAG: VOC family protein [Nitrososphaerales archaeon]